MRLAGAVLALLAAPLAAQELRDIAAEALAACGGTRIVLSHAAVTPEARDDAVEVLNRRLESILPFGPGGVLGIGYAVPGEGDRLVVRLPASEVTAAAFEGVLVRGAFGFHAALPVGQGGIELPFADRPEEALALDPEPVLTQDDLARAEVGFDQNNLPAVHIRFTPQGGALFGQVTADKHGEVFALVYDGDILTAPRIMAPITGGQGMISGDFTLDAATELAVILNSGALNVDLAVETVEQVAGDPGADRNLCPRLPQ
ncbi:MAG: hypothetical protein HLUCCA08_04470 [Rhodobacteraceae bacterium HLUCCA08]|nr:MAG: hypothetical protein HLUCCA08_04470 [Rhodobacteraceae bacterium HLUCCA08]